LKRALEEIEERGVNSFGRVADVRSREEVERFVTDGAEALGGIDILVNNVGGASGGGLLESSDQDWMETFEVNLFHAVRTTRAVLPHMQQRGGGAVVTIASISGWKPAPRAQYGCAKAAEIFLAGGLALELAEANVRVNTVAPGSIMFPGGGWERFREENPERYGQFKSRELPAGRLGTAEEVADVVAFVVSERAHWVNGAMIPVDGAQGRPSAF